MQYSFCYIKPLSAPSFLSGGYVFTAKYLQAVQKKVVANSKANVVGLKGRARASQCLERRFQYLKLQQKKKFVIVKI